MKIKITLDKTSLRYLSAVTALLYEYSIRTHQDPADVANLEDLIVYFVKRQTSTRKNIPLTFSVDQYKSAKRILQYSYPLINFDVYYQTLISEVYLECEKQLITIRTARAHIFMRRI